MDAFAGWDEEYRVRIRVIATRAYHALFMQNMLVMPTKEELESFEPEFTIYNAGCFPANRYTEGKFARAYIGRYYHRERAVQSFCSVVASVFSFRSDKSDFRVSSSGQKGDGYFRNSVCRRDEEGHSNAYDVLDAQNGPAAITLFV